MAELLISLYITDTNSAYSSVREIKEGDDYTYVPGDFIRTEGNQAYVSNNTTAHDECDISRNSEATEVVGESEVLNRKLLEKNIADADYSYIASGITLPPRSETIYY